MHRFPQSATVNLSTLQPLTTIVINSPLITTTPLEIHLPPQLAVDIHPFSSHQQIYKQPWTNHHSPPLPSPILSLSQSHYLPLTIDHQYTLSSMNNIVSITTFWSSLLLIFKFKSFPGHPSMLLVKRNKTMVVFVMDTRRFWSWSLLIWSKFSSKFWLENKHSIHWLMLLLHLSLRKLNDLM